MRKIQSDEAHKKVVADSYLKRFNELSHETADGLKQRAINLYITEQFCQGERYYKPKNELLI